jgi:hypothetical protein
MAPDVMVGEGELEQEEGEERHLRVEHAAVVVGRRCTVQEESTGGR